MDHKIVILERTSVIPATIRFVMRADVPAARQAFYADANKVSAYKDCTAPDLAALKAGEIVEKVDAYVYTGSTVAQIKAALEAHQAEFQADVTADGQQNQWKFYGTTWNGSAWTTGGVN